MKDAFILDIENQINKSRMWQRRYLIFHIFLTVVITANGFLTAVSSNHQLKELPIFDSGFILFYGLSSAVSAILIQTLKPQEKYAYHRRNKIALRNICDAVKYNNMEVPDAQKYRATLASNSIQDI